VHDPITKAWEICCLCQRREKQAMRSRHHGSRGVRRAQCREACEDHRCKFRGIGWISLTRGVPHRNSPQVTQESALRDCVLFLEA
jgi:hypothetical protein